MEENKTIEILKSLTKSLRDCANYFDEVHEYERMNELDKVYDIFKQFTIITKNIIDEQIEYGKFEDEFGKDENKRAFYVIPKFDCDLLIDTIRKVDKMKPFHVERDNEQ